MVPAGSVASESLSVTEAVETFRALRAVGGGIDVASCGPSELRLLTAGIRDGQRALDALLMRVGAAADAQQDRGDGEDAAGVFLGNGSAVVGRAAHREADRARTAAGLSRVGAAVEAGLIGAAQVDAIALAAKGLSPEERQQLNTAEMISAAASLPAEYGEDLRRVRSGTLRGDRQRR